MALVKTITRALTHALSPTLVETLSQTPEQRYYCYMCHSQGISSYCVYCDARTTTQTSKAMQIFMHRIILIITVLVIPRKKVDFNWPAIPQSRDFQYQLNVIEANSIIL